jgi:sec-independent protein translocase protein TatC
MAEEEKDMSFLEHLEELRRRLWRSLVVVGVAAVALFIAKDFLTRVVFGPYYPDFISYQLWCELSQSLGLGDKLCVEEINFKLQNLKMAGGLLAHMTTALVGGVVIGFPYIFYQIWQFIKPGLKQREISSVRGITFFVSLLFFLGGGFGYFVLAPLSVQFLGDYEFGAVNAPDMRSFIKLVTGLTLATGLMFQLPVLVYFLAKIGLVTPDILKRFRKHALVVVLVVAAIITPPDVTSQILVSIPVLLLYELSIIIARRVQKKKDRGNLTS